MSVLIDNKIPDNVLPSLFDESVLQSCDVKCASKPKKQTHKQRKKQAEQNTSSQAM